MQGKISRFVPEPNCCATMWCMEKPRALISVSDTTGVTELAAALVHAGYLLLATSGTAKTLRAAGIAASDVGAYTGFPELFGGRVKTLHPRVHGGILYRRDNESDVADAETHGIEPIDIVVANLYPFEETVAKGAQRTDCIEHIDIGGVALIRSAAKNHAFTTIVTDPRDYPTVVHALETSPIVPEVLRTRLAAKAFALTARYDTAIARYLGAHDTPLPTGSGTPLRYGENPHQRATLFGDMNRSFVQHHGKELSYNNMLDMAAARGLIREFTKDKPTVAILKHTNPCGVGTGPSLASAWDKAYATDRSAPFGGIVVTNRKVDAALARKMSALFLEIVLAPGFEKDALTILTQKKQLRLVSYRPDPRERTPVWQLRSIGPELVLAQEEDVGGIGTKLTTVSKRVPTAKERAAMQFAWKVAKHVKSNAVVFASADRTLGIGAGQMSRVDSSRIAVQKAKDAKLSLKGCAVASDAFLPFADTLVAAAKAGARSLIQPGGSIRDTEVIKAADTHKMAMVFTGVRHFRH